MTTELMHIGDAARRFGIPTMELVEAWYYRRIRAVKVEGIPRLPVEAVEQYLRDRDVRD